MVKPITSVFEDRVKALGTKDDDGKIAVIFRRHSAFYSIDPSLAVDVELLEKSRAEKCNVQITADALSMEILNVSSVTED